MAETGPFILNSKKRKVFSLCILRWEDGGKEKVMKKHILKIPIA